MRGLDLLKFRRRQLWRRFVRAVKQLGSVFLPWKSRLRSIEANFGTGKVLTCKVVLSWPIMVIIFWFFPLSFRCGVLFPTDPMAVFTQHHHHGRGVSFHGRAVGSGQRVVPQLFAQRHFGRVGGSGGVGRMFRLDQFVGLR